jgi:glycosyltransferase involved in cell wall biosynthesis
MMSKYNNTPLVSVILPVYNAAPFLPEAIESILGQTYTPFELIIIDDQSTDGSRDIIADHVRLDKRVLTIFRNQRGIASAMNEGVRLARGEWIARMDADNIALPERLAVQLDWIKQKNLDVCGAQAETFGIKEEKLWFPETHETVCHELFFRCSILYPTAIIRTEIFRNNLYVNDCVFDDYELFTRLAPRYRLGNVPSVLLRYRHHETQVSIVMRKEVRKDFQKYRFRYFYQTYPHTPLSDYLPLARVSDHLPVQSLQELKLAGQWLAKLSKVPDAMVRQKMGRRWQETCERSATLGKEVDIIFRYFMEMIIKDSM